MTVTPKIFNRSVITLAALGVLAFPLWPWCRWGYFPFLLFATLIAVLFALRHLART